MKTGPKTANQYSTEKINNVIDSAEKIATQYCSGPCGQEYPLTLDYWHSDSSKETGFYTKCKTCTNAQKKIERERKAELAAYNELMALRKSGALNYMALALSSRDKKTPRDCYRLRDAISEAFGGVEGIAAELAMTFHEANIGSNQRASIMKSIIQLFAKCDSLKAEKSDIDEMDIEQLEKEIQVLTAEYNRVEKTDDRPDE